MFNLNTYLKNQKELIEQELLLRMPSANSHPATLHQAMHYSVFAGGKRIRPILCLAAAEAAGGINAQALTAALALEVLHTYTLIHDDLPAMDNDDLRRGKPTCHRQFGEAIAILAGDALLTLAFEWLGQTQAPPPYHPNTLVLELAGASGSKGVIGGQAEDLAAEGKLPDVERLAYIHQHKTATLVRAATRMGAIAAGASATQLAAITGFGNNIGLSFQIADDILNETSSSQALGKATQTDRAREKMTYVSVHGLQNARQKTRELTQTAIKHLAGLPGNTETLKSLALYLEQRTN